ncbi:ComEC/Rec2 family competence protein [Micromonospora sp. CA-111912]|uniref:ComEC/Rec2 family competence protein n=1 Tax=Micromonospora sp. CA-111912 TaxID=3239955 RepID=UPI003D914476
MTWSLEIHHIDLVGSGDSTLIVARDDGVGGGHAAQIRTVLIDGGRLGHATRIDGYLTAAVPEFANGTDDLDVMVVTHYDADHMGGVRGLLARRNTQLYDNVLIFDQGEPVNADEDPYLLYVNAIARPGTARTRVTRNVSSDTTPVHKQRAAQWLFAGPVPGVRTPPVMFGGGVPVPLGGNAAIAPPPALVAPGGAVIAPFTLANWWHPYWLVGREILWTDAAGEPLNSPTPAAPPPTIICIAANRFVRNGAATATYRSGGMLTPPEQTKNEKSLAFEVRFGNFRYYIGGDIEAMQEQSVSAYLNPVDSVAQRVHIVKASHHGANTATTRAFVDRMRPEVVLISCGTRNQFSHPADRTVGILEGYAGATPAPPAPAAPGRAVPSYLTGYQVRGTPLVPPQSRGGPTSRTAGSQIPPMAQGNLRVDVSQVQADRDARGLWAVSLAETIIATAAVTGVVLPAALVPNAIHRLVATGPRAALVTTVITGVLGGLGAAGAAAPAVAAGIAVATLAGGMAAVLPAVYAAATGAGAAAAQAAVAAAAGGLVCDLALAAAAMVPALAQTATQAAATLAGVAGGPAAAAGAAANAAVIAAAPGGGRFTVTFYDRNAMGGAGNRVITHH